jgi:hypothetical protein
MNATCEALEKHIDDVAALESDHDRSDDISRERSNAESNHGTENNINNGTVCGPSFQLQANQEDEDESAGQELPEYSNLDPTWEDDLAGSLHGPSNIPRMDAFKNPFVRIIHVNGVHHLPLMTCDCRGADQIPADLMFLGLVPTTFAQFRTLATSEVLDHIRHSNLDLKASTWQYHRLLRRQTQPLPVEGNINLYKELRRLSREWRWMKKLKWAGYGHGTFLSEDGIHWTPGVRNADCSSVPSGTESNGTAPAPASQVQHSSYLEQPSQVPTNLGDPLKPKSGALANFCAACPQVGINLCPDWDKDPNQWVYTRFVVLDGNFKADHVRQIADDYDDIWLSNGGGMFAKQDDYHEFLRTARQRRSVCRSVPLLVSH